MYKTQKQCNLQFNQQAVIQSNNLDMRSRNRNSEVEFVEEILVFRRLFLKNKRLVTTSRLQINIQVNNRAKCG